ncbi:MAG: hypothetical protein H7Z40_13925 [Phycisphaerae bacterium]|nr:hypothetical protein [Gemmatimonadaceae bacterium]
MRQNTTHLRTVGDSARVRESAVSVQRVLVAFWRSALICGATVAGATGVSAQSSGPPPAPAPATPAGSPIAAPTAGTPAPTPLVGPAIRRIESASAVSTEQLGSINTVRQLSGGRLLLNDGTRRRLLLLDSTLKVIGIVLDSLTDVQNAYGTRSGSLIAYRADSTLFVDPATFAMLVIDGDGRIVRVRSVPRAQDASLLTNIGTSNGVAALDGKGRLVYRISAQAARPLAPPRSDMPYLPQQPDSAFVIGISLDTRKVDTLGVVRTPRVVFSITRSENGFETRSAQSPLPLVDDWAVLPDGTVAFVRGRDFRVDYINPDGSASSSGKLPFPWVRLTEDEKIKFVDSMKVVETKNAQNNYVMQMITWSNLLNKPYPSAFKVTPGFELRPGLPNDWILPEGVKFPQNYVYACPPVIPGITPPVSPPSGAPSASGALRCYPNEFSNYYGSGYTPPAPTYRAPTLIPASEMPDYKPPISPGSVRADADGNLWIRTIQMKPMPGGQIYDIVSRKGELVDRIQLPPGYQLAGFGAGKVVYLSMRDATGLHLARVRLR